MKQFIKENWFKIALIICLIIAFLQFSSFVELKRANENRIVANMRDNFDKKIKCQNMYNEFKRINNRVLTVFYNSLQNTCSIKHLDVQGEMVISDMEDGDWHFVPRS